MDIREQAARSGEDSRDYHKPRCQLCIVGAARQVYENRGTGSYNTLMDRAFYWRRGYSFK